MTTETNWFDKANLWIRKVESSFLNFIGLIIPYLVSLIPAYMSWQNLQAHVHFSPEMAYVGGAVIEGLGVTTLHTLVQFWHFNRTNAPVELDENASPQAKAAARKKERRMMPLWLPIVSYAFYMACVLVLNVLLDAQTLPPFEIIARGILCLLPIPSGLMLATRTLHTEMLMDIQREKDARKVTGKVTATPESSRKVTATLDDWRKVPKTDRVRIADMEPKEVEISYRVPDRTARNWVNNAKREKVINGSGNGNHKDH